MEFGQRIHRLHQQFHELRVDGLLITHLPNIRYLCGFTGSAGILVIEPHKAVLFTDGRYTQQAREETRSAKPRITKNPLAAAAEHLSTYPAARRLGIEATHMTVAEKKNLRSMLPRNCKIVAAPPAVERMRMVKDGDEISKIRAACALGVELFNRLTTLVRPGERESKAAADLEFAARTGGAEQMAFPTIIASGGRSSLPHGRASNTPMPRRGFVVCDFGVILAGYCSDMTRTLHLGRPSPEARTLYEAVLEAQKSAVASTKPGVTVGEVDAVARKLLQKYNLRRFFSHSTGHGLGLEIHEAPRVASGQSEVLRPGMVITIEPGIYLPGRWGVRIEDTVVVTENGCEILTRCPKDLLTV